LLAKAVSDINNEADSKARCILVFLLIQSTVDIFTDLLNGDPLFQAKAYSLVRDKSSLCHSLVLLE